MNKPQINLKYKDTVFTKYFSDKNRLIEVYNAVNGTNYKSNVKFEINTLENILFLGKYNDISFKIANRRVVLAEHQSTINRNMPLRFLLYIAKIYEKIIENENIYKTETIELATPEFIVFYNGADKLEDESEMKLSDAFKDKSICQLELKVKVYNINKGHNEKILCKSESLSGYSILIARVRENQKKGMDDTAAMIEAIKYCRENNIMKEFLEKYESEVLNMLTEEFNIETALKVRSDESYRIGEKRGEKKKATETALKALKMNISIEDISDLTGLSVSEIEKLRNK